MNVFYSLEDISHEYSSRTKKTHFYKDLFTSKEKAIIELKDSKGRLPCEYYELLKKEHGYVITKFIGPNFYGSQFYEDDVLGILNVDRRGYDNVNYGKLYFDIIFTHENYILSPNPILDME